MSSTVILAAAAAFALGCVFCLGLWWLSAHRSRRGRMETMKAAVWLCLCNGCAWVWCSYLLAYLGREHVARFPERTDYPWKDQKPDDVVVATRCAALGRIARGEACVLVTSARALLRCAGRCS